MTESAGPRGWRRATDAYQTMMRSQQIRVRQMLLLWAAAVALVVLTFAAFLSALYWLFN